MRPIDYYDQPLSLMADFLDRFGTGAVSRAAQAVAWRVTDDHGGWAAGNRILCDEELAEQLERLYPSWAAVASAHTA